MRKLLIKSMIMSAIMSLTFFVACSDDVDTDEPKVIAVTGVTLEQEMLNFVVESDPDTLVATVLPSTATNKKITWKSSDEAIATVDENGVVTPLVVGNTTIIVTTEDGKKTDTCDVAITAKGIAVNGISIDKDVLDLAVGETPETLVATVLPLNATNKTITWSSENTSVARVSSRGAVTAVSNGTTTITATTEDGEMTATCAVNVMTKVTSLTIDHSALYLALAEGAIKELTLVATVLPSNATNKDITWESSNAAIASVVDGVVKPLAVGETNIIVATENGKKKDTCVVTVTQEEVIATGVELNDCQALTGVPQTMTVKLLPENATYKKYEWSWLSANPDLLTIDTDGVITPLKTGNVMIRVANDELDISATAVITIQQGVEKIIIAPAGIVHSTEFFEGGLGRIVASVYVGYIRITVEPVTAVNKATTWSSSDESIATIDPQTGFITPLKVGEANMIITALDGSGVSASIEITVKPKQDHGHDGFEEGEGEL